MAQSFLKGTLILTMATLLSKILGSFFRVPLQNIAGDEVLGIFSIVYPIYMVALTLSVAGIPVAISKLISEARARNDFAYVQHLKSTASRLAIVFGVIAFAIVFFGARPLTGYLGSSTYYAIIFVSFTLLIAPYMAVYRGYFQGHENMTHTGVSQILEQFVRVFFILAIAWWFVSAGYSNEVVAGGVMAASIVGALASLGYLLVMYRKRPKVKLTQQNKPETFWPTAKKILLISLPISVGAITMALFNVVDSLTVPRSLGATGLSDNEVAYQYGIFGRGLALVQIATVFSTAVVLSLIPLVSKLRAKGEETKVKQTLEKIFAYTHILSWPIGAGLFVLTVGVNIALFTNAEGSDVLAVLNISSIVTALAVLSTGVLQSLNKPRKAALYVIVAVFMKVILNIFLINKFSLMGAAYSTLLVYTFLWILNMVEIRKSIAFQLGSKSLMLSVVGSAFMGTILYLIVNVIGWEFDSRFITLAAASALTMLGALLYFSVLIIGHDPYVLELLKNPRIQKFLPKSKSGGNKVKKFTPWLLLVLTFLLAFPGIIQRHQIEWANDQYEMVMPYDVLDELSKENEDWPIETILTELRVAGLDSISLEPETLNTQEKEGNLTVFSTEDLNRYSLLNPQFTKLSERSASGGILVFIHNQNNVTDQIKEVFEAEEITVDNLIFYFIERESYRVDHFPIVYDEKKIETIKENGLTLIPRIKDFEVDKNPILFNQLKKYSTDANVLFAGQSVLGFADPITQNKIAEYWSESNTNVYDIESSKEKGFKSLTSKMDNQVVRLISLSLSNAEDVHVSVDKAVRAVKERNIRSVFVRPPALPVEESIPQTVNFMNQVQANMPVFYQDGSPKQYTDVSKWTIYLGLIGAVLFTTFALQKVFSQRWLTILGTVGVMLAGLGYLVTNQIILLQALILGLAILTPISALYPINGIKNSKGLVLKYFEVILITSVGIAVMVSVFNGQEFFLKLEEFKGVKVLYIAPIAFAFIYALYGHIMKILNTAIKYRDAIIMGIVLIIVAYYISRSGNSGSVSNIELIIRQKLEELLYARPRTKEFLIGFPMLVFAIYMTKYSKLVSKYLMIPSAIGVMSMVNTFTHFHIPLHVSILRSIHSILIGFILGLVLIFLFEQGKKLYESKIKPRWSK
ncbi:DUF5693 family protein [Mangrovibacillus cuniculi]|uniref:Polysaccharide biosynthesis protein n=1 Tax=Mangrovibacillus cuniculi TaxID=2593652 RepID=A0A7S8CCN3_9BACI|nr:DUF5693 family protein [Mangrovibacillus cuniculi]QPC47529.1 polysaccharide biosynthesis protein [Mangrovibacillus cuniculi]